MDSKLLTSALEKLPSRLTKNLEKNLCVCNEVPKIKIITAIVEGASTLAKIKQQTYATMGSGCCTQQVEKLIEYLSVPEG